jgi:predicted DNA-binding transcriptional regulator AlpA
MRYAMPIKVKPSTPPVVLVPGPLVQPPVALGLPRPAAAAYIGVGVSLFDEMVADGRMPRPKQINSRKVWHREPLAEAFAELPEEGQGQESSSPWMDCA